MTTEFKFGDNTYTIEEESRFIVNNKEFKTREAAEEYIRNKDKNDILQKYRVDPELEEALTIPMALYRKYFPQLALMDNGFKVYKANNNEELSEIFDCICAIKCITVNCNSKDAIINRMKIKELSNFPEYIFFNKFRKCYLTVGDILEDGKYLADSYQNFLDDWNKFKTTLRENNISGT